MSSATTRALSALILLPLLLAVIWWAPHWLFDAVLVVTAFLAALELRRLVRDQIPFAALVAVYLIVPIYLLQRIRDYHGPGALMTLIGVIVVSDTAQFYTGRGFGRRKLAPAISPKKTVEGAIGGAVFGAMAGVVCTYRWLPAIPPVTALVASLLIAIAGMAGDLFESWLKRRAGVKDSGDLIPGHGGMLDRIDSWLFASPVFWLFLSLFVRTYV